MNFWRSRLAVGGAAVAIAGITIASIPPARAAIEDAMSCAQSSPCLEWDNTGSGDAVKGVSKGNALHGQTKFKSVGKTAGKAGVFGEDLSTAGNLNAGVLGASANGAGVMGTSTSYNAVEGLSANSTGVYGQTSAAAGFGAAGRNVSTSHDNNGAGLLADGGPANDGLHAFSTTSNAIYGFSSIGIALVAHSDTGSTLDLSQGSSDTSPELLLQANNPSQHYMILVQDNSNKPLFYVLQDGEVVSLGGISAQGGSTGVAGSFFNSPGDADLALRAGAGTTGTNQPAFLLTDSNGTGEMQVSDTGNVTINGLIRTQGSCNSGCIVNHKRVRGVGEYAPVATQATLEDDGEASLLNGRADVALDPRLVNAIDTTATYLVSVTPEGDCHGLFVASRTPRGFTVRELEGGRSSVAFEYRIVAKPFGVNAPRLPMTAIQHMNVPRTGPKR